jgi:hypothetical protein
MEQKPPPPRADDVPADRLVAVGGPVDQATVSLRLFGDDLDPDQISVSLGCEPTAARRKGDIIPDKRYHRVAPTGSWLLQDPVSSLAIQEQVGRLLDRVTGDLAVWRDLKRRFRVDLFCGLFLEDWNRGFSLSPDLMRRLADRGLEVGFDIYGYWPEEFPTPPVSPPAPGGPEGRA